VEGHALGLANNSKVAGIRRRRLAPGNHRKLNKAPPRGFPPAPFCGCGALSAEEFPVRNDSKRRYFVTMKEFACKYDKTVVKDSQ
jgi:hypothetical protein